MTTTPPQEQARALGDPTRHAIFRHIAEADHPVGVAELSAAFTVNHNAIRQHLAKLVAARLVVETTEHGPRRGRPRLVYVIDPRVEGQWATSGPYERLSRLLVEVIRTRLDAREVGRRAAPAFRATAQGADGVERVAAAMMRYGFEPEVRATPAGADIVLHHCPFATAAVADRSVVCALHLGVAEGLVEGSGAAVEELVAYDPRKARCRLRLRAVADETSRGAGMLSLRGRASRA